MCLASPAGAGSGGSSSTAKAGGAGGSAVAAVPSATCVGLHSSTAHLLSALLRRATALAQAGAYVHW